MKTAIFTICSRNYLAYALTLQKSLQVHEPDRPFFIYLADAPLEPGTEPDATIIPVRDLGLPDLLDMAFRYTVMEFNTAIKADCFLDLLTNRGFEAAVFLDPDIMVYAPLEAVHSALGAGASVVLTPHILEPLPERAQPDDNDILRTGVFNLGFAVFSAAEDSLRFLRWWARKLHRECYAVADRGMFVDQRFADLAPGFIANLYILRHPGFNVAYWNLANRRLETSGGNVLVNGQPLVFFHFSGVAPGNPDVFTRHHSQANRDSGEVECRLMQSYQDELVAQGQAVWVHVPYAFAQFGDGSPILPPMRRRVPASGTPEDWFAAPDTLFWNSPDPRVDQEKGITITRLMMGFLDMRPDLQAAFPIGSAAGRRGLHAWFCRHGAREYKLPEQYLPDDTRHVAARGIAAVRARLAHWIAIGA